MANHSFTASQTEAAFRRLMGALRAGKLYEGRPNQVQLGQPELPGLPTCSGEYREEHFKALDGAFLLRDSETSFCHGELLAFKHGPSRNYLYVKSSGFHAAFIPITNQPFFRGEFPNYGA